MQDDRSPGRRPVIGILSDVRQIGIHPFHAVGEKYIEAVANGAEALPVLIPATEPGGDLRGIQRPEDYLDIVDGLFLPGSPSNVEPRHYGFGESRPGRCQDCCMQSRRCLTSASVNPLSSTAGRSSIW